MPQTTPDRAARWPGMDQEAMDFLRSRGFRLLRNWTWLAPAGHNPDDKEKDAIMYLIEEWDFGGWVDAPPAPTT